MEHQDLSVPSGLSDAQYKLLTLLPIPSSILSILGSTIIIYFILHHRRAGRRRWTPYTRLLLGMSICDIVSSISIAIAGFLRPQDSVRPWAFGNDATCSISGFLIQFSWSGMLYYNMLSLYFLLSARFGMKNSSIARRIEPIMHFVAVGYPWITGVVGAVMGLYAETTAGFGCWVNDYPRGCTEDVDVECQSVIIGSIFYGIPFWISALMLLWSNIPIFFFVRNQVKSYSTRPSGTTAAHSTTRGISTVEEEKVVDDALRDSPEPSSVPDDSKSQAEDCNSTLSVCMSHSINSQCYQIKRLRLVRSQALLFVAAYVLSVGWFSVIILMEGLAAHKADEISMTVKYFPVLVGNAIFAPLAGFLNCFVFLRPKYLRWKHRNPQNRNLRDFWRTLFEAPAASSPENTPKALPKPVIDKIGHKSVANSSVERHVKSHDAGIASLIMSLHYDGSIRQRQSGNDCDDWLSSAESPSTVEGQFDYQHGLAVISEITSSGFERAPTSIESNILCSDMLSSGSNTTLSSHIGSPPDIEGSRRQEDRWSASTSSRPVHANRSCPHAVTTDETLRTEGRRRERLCRWSPAVSSKCTSKSKGAISSDAELPMPKRLASETDHQDNSTVTSQTCPTIPITLESAPPQPSEGKKAPQA